MEFNLFLALFSLFAVAVASPGTKVYRTDYVYNKKTDAFYKLHIDTQWYVNAKERCQAEGAQIMVPASQEDIAQVHSMMKKLPDIGDLVWVGYDGQEHESAEETPMVNLEPEDDPPRSGYSTDCDVLTRTGEIGVAGCYNRKLPFVCKVEAKDTEYDEQCHVYAKGYHYYSAIGSCYRVPNVAFRWDEALAECKAEGAHLFILNSPEEAATIKQFLTTVSPVSMAYRNYFFFAGIRATKPKPGQPREFRTVFNETLEQVGYTDCWSAGEPNNYLNLEDCGTIFTNTGKYNDVDCSDRYGFICEKEIHT